MPKNGTIDEKIRGLVVDPKTGEIKGNLNEVDRILKQKSLAYLQETQEWNMGHFFKGSVEEVRKILVDLSTCERAFLFSIMAYISYDDCHLGYSNGEDIGTNDLINIGGMGRSTTFEVINSLIKKDILYKGRNSKNRQYFINPWLFCKGHRINKVLRTMFKNYKIRVLNGIQWKNL